MTSTRSLLALACLSTLLACTHPRTQIVVQIETDMPQGPAATLTHIRVTVKAPNGATTRQRLTYALRQPDLTGQVFELPATLGVTALDNDGSRSVEIDVDAVNDPGRDGTSVSPMFTWYGIAPFADERTMLLRVFLADRCRQQVAPCGPDETCGATMCEPRRRTLTEVAPDYRVDGGAHDAAIDSATADAPDATVTDATDATVIADGADVLDGAEVLDAEVSLMDISCPSGQVLCGGACVDTSVRADHCGACGMTCVARPNSRSACRAGGCALECSSGFADCNGALADGCEVDLRVTTASCGGCATACSFVNAAASCSGGLCRLGACRSGFDDCDMSPANGCETDIASSVGDCGGCNRGCAPANASGRCAAGACAVGACSRGFDNCDGAALNGCEVNLMTSAAHCGACGRTCATGQFCVNGVCENTCAAPRTDCRPGCVNLATDNANCGACGRACTPGVNQRAACAAGICESACNAGYGDCDTIRTNGCESSLDTPARCGSCTNACSATNAMVGCASSGCFVSGCNAGFGNCDGLGSNGCEVSTSSDVNNCGGCGNRCSFASATAACVMGVCALGACATGRLNCDGNPLNGCETDAQADPRHCGGCGIACPVGRPSCVGGACVGTCGSPSTMCGSECVNTQSNLTHCGRCFSVCASPPSATAACASGTCGIGSCFTGRADCNGRVPDGCEVDTTTDVNHCGACSRRCALGNATASCASGTCRILACNPGFENCDGDHANGCELAVGVACTDECWSGATECQGGARGCSRRSPVACGTPCGGVVTVLVCDGAGLCVPGPATCTPTDGGTISDVPTMRDGPTTGDGPIMEFDLDAGG